MYGGFATITQSCARFAWMHINHAKSIANLAEKGYDHTDLRVASSRCDAAALLTGIPFVGGGVEIPLLAAEDDVDPPEERGICPRHVALAAVHPGHDWYTGGKLLERNISVWVLAGVLLERFDGRARAEMASGADEGISVDLAEEIVEAGRVLAATAAEKATELLPEVVDILADKGHARSIRHAINLA